MSWRWNGTSAAQSLRAVPPVTYRISDGITLAAVVRPMTNGIPAFFMLRSPATNVPIVGLSGALTTGFSCWSRNGANVSGANEINVGYTAGAPDWYLLVGRIVSSSERTLHVFNMTTGQTWFASAGNGIDSTLRADYATWVGASANQSSSTELFLAHAALWDVPLQESAVGHLAKGVNPSKVQRDRLLFYAPLVGSGRVVAGRWASLIGALNSAGQVSEWRNDPPMIEPWRPALRRIVGWMPPPSASARARVAWFGRA